MKRYVLLLVFCLLTCSVAHADNILFESGTLGPTGVSWTDLTTQTIPGANISDFVFNGVRFKLDQPAITTEIGGHFVASENGLFFGALIQLDDENDFPDSGDLMTPDVLGHTLLVFPTSSDEVFGELNLSLDPGWYAVVFGSGLFGTTMNGGAVRNGTDIGNPSYIAHLPSSGWRNLAGTSIPFDNYRHVVNGTIVPEPFSAHLLFLALSTYLFNRKRKRLDFFQTEVDEIATKPLLERTYNAPPSYNMDYVAN